MYSLVRLRAFIGPVAVTVVFLALATRLSAQDDKQVQAVLDKAIKAVGGEEMLRTKSFTWKVNTPEGANRWSRVTVQGLDLLRVESMITREGKTSKYLTVLNGDKGWQTREDKLMTFNKEDVQSQKLFTYPPEVIPLLVKGTGFKLKIVDEQKVDGKPAVGIHVMPPGAKEGDYQDFTLYFDKDSGLLVKRAQKSSYGGGKDILETMFTGYKDFDGIKKATKTQSVLSGRIIDTAEITEFRGLAKVEPGTFDEPK
jgi:hypothetical protein